MNNLVPCLICDTILNSLRRFELTYPGRLRDRGLQLHHRGHQRLRLHRSKNRNVERNDPRASGRGLFTPKNCPINCV